MPAKKKPGDSFRLPHRRHEYFNFFVPQPLGVVPMCESGRNILAKHKKKDLNFIENVRKDYRNPSAHKSRMEFTTAKECLDYVLDVKHMLKEMLIKMKV